MKKRRILLLIVILAAVWILSGNSVLTVTRYTVESDEIPEPFSGFRIAQISDLHNATFGRDNQRLLNRLRRIDPDIIVITGDVVCYFRTNQDIALDFAREAMKIAPVYYVTGNHEAALMRQLDMAGELNEIGVGVLYNQKVRLVRDGQWITLMGVEDPGFLPGDDSEAVAAQLSGLKEEDDGYTILLNHRSELFDTYVSAGMDLVFTGHAHGGQVRLPFIGGLYSSTQGFFPEYDAGTFRNGDTVMVVSRGLGNSRFPLRVNNYPEIVVVELDHEF